MKYLRRINDQVVLLYTVLLTSILIPLNLNGIPSLLPAKHDPKFPQLHSTWRIADLQLELVPISSGRFRMGSGNGRKNERPDHDVYVSRPFWIGKYEINQKLYRQIMDSNPSFYQGETKPVANVSWYDASAFCDHLTNRERKAGRLPTEYIYRLPTEAEWEYSCRAGSTQDFNFGDDVTLLYKHANYCDLSNTNRLPWQDKHYDDGYNKPAPVGSFAQNSWGIYDMHGNVWEWCLDYFGPYSSESLIDPCGPKSGFNRILRGGSWYHAPRGCRSSNRDGVDPGSKDKDFGFRVVLGHYYTEECVLKTLNSEDPTSVISK